MRKTNLCETKEDTDLQPTHSHICVFQLEDVFFGICDKGLNDNDSSIPGISDIQKTKSLHSDSFPI